MAKQLSNMAVLASKNSEFRAKSVGKTLGIEATFNWLVPSHFPFSHMGVSENGVYHGIPPIIAI